MSFHPRGIEKRKFLEEYGSKEEDIIQNMKRDSMDDQDEYDSSSGSVGKGPLDQDKRIRREIANSNERRRMQSINAGFQSLKTLLPHQQGEKLSKAAILQQTADYINNLEREKTKLLAQNSQLKRMFSNSTGVQGSESDGSQNSPPPKRKKRDTESSDEGISIEEPTADEVKREMIELRNQLDRERRLRLMLEDQTRNLEAQLYPERLRQIATHVHAQMRYQEEKKLYMNDHQRRMQEQMRHRPQPESQQPPFVQSSMSRRNLETIVEAIRHLEGENVLFDGGSRLDESKDSTQSDENSSVSEMEPEDCKSDISGRDSPMSSESSDSVHVQQNAMNAEKYPIAMQLLHRPPSYPVQVLPPVQRPAVIVQNSS